MKNISRILPKVIKPLFKGEGFTYGSLLLDWNLIVGVLLARHCFPEKLTFPKGQRRQGTLTIHVASASSPYIQHMNLQIMDKINSYFGFKAIERIKIIQGALKASSKSKKKIPSKIKEEPSKSELKALLTLVQPIENPELQQALLDLGKSLSCS